MKDKPCEYCKEMMTPTGNNHKACNKCQVHLENVTAQVKRDVIRFNKFGTYDSIGKGGSNLKGEDHPQYVSGRGRLSQLRVEVKARRHCERCAEDLIAATRYEWCVHHSDHNRDNNTLSNLELLCKRCHQLEHGCVGNIQAYNSNVQRLSRKGVEPSGSKR